MDFNTASTYKRLGIPDALVNTIFIFSIALVIAPYVGGADFGIFKVPVFPIGIGHVLKWSGPCLLLIAITFFIPVWKTNNQTEKKIEDDKPEEVHVESKYRLQSTPDIILNELQKRNVNTDGIKIVPGFNINDLKKRIKILNSQLTDEKVCDLVEAAREIAFTSKYSAPREDEKLENLSNIKVEGIAEWHIYLQRFLLSIGISDVKNIKVLDVGIGNAYASQVFLSNCADLTGVDVSREALTYAKNKLYNAKLQVGSAENLKDIKSFSVDLYTSLRTYQSTLFDIKESLHEAYRVLAKGGGIVISVPIMFLKKDEAGNILNVLKGLIPQGSSVPSIECALEISNKIRNYLEILGFRDIEINTESPFEIYIGARK